MKDNYKYLVCVRCMTFNHSKYIEKALDGFCMQDTTFPFVCLIVDDKSTDGEQEILLQYVQQNFNLVRPTQNRGYGEEVFAQHKSNKNCYFVILLLNQNHYSIRKDKLAYLSEWRDASLLEAICEGDDYWIDSQKLHKQATFLRDHSEYVLSTHAFQRLENGELKSVINGSSTPFTYDLKKGLHNWLTQPLTALYRIDAYPSKEEIAKYDNYMDNHLFYLILKKGLGYHIGDSMGVYRISGEGVWTSISKAKAYKSDLRSYLELYRHNNDKLLKWKIASVYSTYLSEAVFEKDPIAKIPFDVLGLYGTSVVFVKTLKKLFSKWLNK